MVRRALYARLGYQLGMVDCSLAEVRVGLCYHNDPVMRRYVLDKTSDMHGDLAKQIFKLDILDKKIPAHYTLRQAAKNSFVFPQFYGDYYVGCAKGLACKWGKLPKTRWRPGQGIEMPDGTHLSDHLISVGIKSYEAFEKHVQKVENDFWGNRFKVYANWKERWWHQYQKYGFFDLLTGFRCSGVMKRNDVTNYPIQGSAFHCLLWSFIQIDRIAREERWKSRLIGQIHDEMVLDIFPPELDHVMTTIHRVFTKDLPKAWRWITIPIEVEGEVCDVDESWADGQPYQFKEVA
jgi:hypothetical protein